MASGIRVEYEVHFKRDRRARKVVRQGPLPAPPPESVPRIARLLALAWKWEGMVRRREVKDSAEVARLTKLTRMRVSQILGLTLLAPDIQERILLTSPAPRARSIPEHRLRDLSAEPFWVAQQSILALRELAPRSLPPTTSA
jgi:hypothetical protein